MVSFQDQDQRSSPHAEKHVRVGRIAAPHGVKGLVKILPLCEDVSLIEQVEGHETYDWEFEEVAVPGMPVGIASMVGSPRGS